MRALVSAGAAFRDIAEKSQGSASRMGNVRAAVDALESRADVTGVWIAGFRLGGTLGQQVLAFALQPVRVFLKLLGLRHGVIASGQRAVIEQGIEMQRASRISIRGAIAGDRVTDIRVGGHVVEVMTGEAVV